MNYYNYTAVSVDGETIKGVMEAESEESAASTLEQGGLYPVEVRQGSNLTASFNKLTAGSRVKKSEIIEFAQNLSVMLRAGVSIMSAMSDIIETTPNRAFADILLDIKQNIERGSSFTDGIERHRAVFPDIFIRLVRVGEETGQFEGSLADVADHLKKVAEVTAAIKQALIYPIFAVVSTIGALMFWMIYVLPKMIDTLKGLGVKLPLLTRILMKSSALSQKYWYVVIVFPVVCSLIISYLNRKPASRYYVDLVKLKLPIYKTIMLYKTMSLFTEQMRILIRSGMTIDRTFDMVADVIGNEVYKRSILRVKEELLYGAFISDCLKAEKIYPILIIRMVSIGENSGTLDNQFGFLSEHYRGLLDNFSKNLGKIIEPLVIIVVGAIFAVIILGLMMPIYDLVATVGKGANK